MPINLPNSENVDEIVLPNGASANELYGPNGNLLWEAGDMPDSELIQQADHVWYMDEGTGSTVSDGKGSSDGSISGASWVTDSGGVGDAYLDFDGTDDIVTTKEVIPSNSSFTATAWVQGTSKGDAYIFQQNISDGFLLWSLNGGELQGNIGSGDIGEIFRDLTDGDWFFVAVAWDGSTAYFYVYEPGNGQVFSDSWSSSSTDMSGDLTFGNRPDLSRPWDKGIDMITVSLSKEPQSTITDHFNETKEFYQ